MLPSPLHPPSLLLAALATGVIVNVGQYLVVEREATTVYEAVHVKEGHDLRSLVEEHFPGTQASFGLSVQLRELAPGVEVALPTGANVQDARLLGIGLASRVTRTDYDTSVTPAVAARLEAEAVADGDDRGFGPYTLALADGDVEQVVLVTGSERTYIADRRLLERFGSAVSP